MRNFGTGTGGIALRNLGFAWRFCCACLLVFLTVIFSVSAHAQTVNTYTNTTAGAIVDSTDCSATVTRTFTVGTSFTVSDVNLGVYLTHTYRSDLRISLRSPAGTTVNIMGNTAGEGDNLNDLFDDEATASITTHGATVTDPTTVPPPYSHSFTPGFSTNPSGFAAALSAFDGQNAQGTWTMVICDSVAQDTGNFVRADLYITQPPTTYADLSVTKTVSNAAPANGATISYTLTAANAAAPSLSATGVTVKDILPTGVSFVSASGTGTYNNATGIWTVGTLAPGASASITITVTVTATSGAAITNGAEVASSSIVDLDSTPNNASTAEDDDAFIGFTVSGTPTAGTPPTLSCPVGSTLFDWNARAWTAGTLNNSYNIAGIGNTNFALSTDFPLVTGSPVLNSTLTGGLTASELSLFINMNNDTVSQKSTTVITLPTAIPGMQFRIFDIDFGNASYADRLVVTGTFNGSAVLPTLTNGTSNYVAGNVAIGNAGATDTTAQGTVVVTFTSPVDSVSIEYGNTTSAPANPGNQYMSIHDITFCNPRANLSVTKISSVLSDGVSSANPKSISGAIVRYCILVSNAGSATATAVNASDPIPADLTFVPGSMFSGTSCGTAGTAEDDDAADTGEADPFTMSYNTATFTVTGNAASLAPAASMALVFNAAVN